MPTIELAVHIRQQGLEDPVGFDAQHLRRLEPEAACSPGRASYSCAVNAMPAALSATVAGVPATACQLPPGSTLRGRDVRRRGRERPAAHRAPGRAYDAAATVTGDSGIRRDGVLAVAEESHSSE